MPKRFAPAATAALLTIALTACGGSSSNKASSSATSSAQTSTATATPSTSKPATTPASTSASPTTHHTVTKTVTAVAPAPTTQSCGTSSETDAVNANIGSIPAPFEDRQWMIDPIFSNTYKPCATLSYVPLSFMGATGSSPEQIMLFHNGSYLGTATAQGYALGDIQQNGDNSIRVQYVDGNHQHYWTTFTYTGGTPSVKMTGTDPSTLP